MSLSFSKLNIQLNKREFNVKTVYRAEEERKFSNLCLSGWTIYLNRFTRNFLKGPFSPSLHLLVCTCPSFQAKQYRERPPVRKLFSLSLSLAFCLLLALTHYK